jgi:hypothetical protein
MRGNVDRALAADGVAGVDAEIDQRKLEFAAVDFNQP